jgi:hypothetical protein
MTSMTLYLNHIFSGVCIRGFQKDDKGLIHGSALFRIDDFTIGKMVGSEGEGLLPGLEQHGADRFRRWTTDTHNPYATLPEGCGDGGDGIFSGPTTGF